MGKGGREQVWQQCARCGRRVGLVAPKNCPKCHFKLEEVWLETHVPGSLVWRFHLGPVKDRSHFDERYGA